MRFDPHKCPECGAVAEGECYLIPSVSRLYFDDDGNVTGEGDGRVCWDGQYPETDAVGRVKLWGTCNHEWLAQKKGE